MAQVPVGVTVMLFQGASLFSYIFFKKNSHGINAEL